jgi:hypothetical protein
LLAMVEIGQVSLGFIYPALCGTVLSERLDSRLPGLSGVWQAERLQGQRHGIAPESAPAAAGLEEARSQGAPVSQRPG